VNSSRRLVVNVWRLRLGRRFHDVLELCFADIVGNRPTDVLGGIVLDVEQRTVCLL